MVVYSQTHERVGPPHHHYAPTLVNVMSRNARYLATGIVRVALALIAIALFGIALDILSMPPLGFPSYLRLSGIGLIALGLYLEAWATFSFWMHGVGTP